MLRELLDRIYSKALWVYISADMYLFHGATKLDDYLTRRGL
jgi:hypothetical protein